MTVSLPEVGEVVLGQVEMMGQIGIGGAEVTNVVLAALNTRHLCNVTVREVAWELRGGPLRAEAPSCRSGERSPGGGAA